jgi:histidinol phosphatase-like PHP family hydrolase
MVNKKKWIKFDLHMHTFRSDGLNSTKKMLMTAKARGLDVVAITDHNIANKLSPKETWEKYGIYTIPGTELSFLNGHLLVLGVDPKLVNEKLKQWKITPKSPGVIARKKTIRKVLKFFVDNGALVIAAHPKIPTGMMSLKGGFMDKLYKEGLIHGAEIHNNDLEIKFKKKLYNMWHKLTEKSVIKMGIPAYADSDAHKYQRLGNRFNMIKLADPTKLLETLKSKKIDIRHGTKSDL